jgi:thermitase
MPIRFLGEDGSGDLYAAAKAIDYATTNGAQIISASWGATVAEAGAAPIIEAIGRANEKGVLFIAAAANNGSNNDTKSVYPANANFPNMIAVAASDSNDAKPTWSNFGVSKVHISAPGHEILSTLPKDKYGKLSGTSMATPLVAGLVALALAVSDQKLDGPTMRAIIQASGTQVAIETACGCRIDAKAALAHIEDRVMTVVPNALTLAPQSTANFTAFNGEPPFKFTSANSAAGDIDATGKFTAKAVGDTKITVTDAKDKVASSLLIHVAEPTASGESCPLGDEALCAMLCAIEPTLPWCGKQFER